MAKGKKTGGKNFPKGHKFGKGAPRLPKPIKEMKTETKICLIEIVKRLSTKSTDELKSILFSTDKKTGRQIPNPKANVLEAIVASAFLKAIAKGEPQRAEVLMQRVLGKVPDKVINKDDRAPDISLVLVENKKEK